MPYNEKSEEWYYQHSELREGAIILMIGTPDALLNEKAEMIMNKRVRDPKMLKIYLDNGTPWLFDKEFNSYSASLYLAEGFPYC